MDINLVDWRERRRSITNNRIYFLIIVIVIFAGCIGGMVYTRYRVNNEAPPTVTIRQNNAIQQLEQGNLCNCSVVGVMRKQNILWGLVQDSAGKVSPVKIDDYSGENSEKVNATICAKLCATSA